jgi:hypothetical protein
MTNTFECIGIGEANRTRIVNRLCVREIERSR